MSQKQPDTKYLSDYRPTDFLIDEVSLDFQLNEEGSLVKSRMSVRRNPDTDSAGKPLRLQGRDLELLSLRVDGEERREIEIGDGTLTLDSVPDEFLLETEVRIHPEKNTSLDGLYKSGGNYSTQCEAEGFRKITWFLDRPDIMARYTVRVEAEESKYPVLLSNGNLMEEGKLEGGRHFAVWQDPFPKPSYLFALVAGQLVCREDSFTTMSGREVSLKIWVREEDLDRSAHAMDSLIKSMRWDEERWGLEYDLDIFNIVAVSDFNMGAMENKSLNIFNTKYVLAHPETATDADFINVEAVIGHEYFHNWTGNRVTVSSWFHLSLKEGLTVFRDQEFTADLNSRAVERISSVQTLRSHQFPEDAGPMAHPIRPQSYIEMNNFYTTTVYEKGSEVIRMYQTLLGRDGFRKGMDLYFDRHDGQAVSTDDFLAAMADANGRDLSQFSLWYEQAGTPTVRAERSWDEESRSFTLTLSQCIPDTPGQSDKKPMHIPVAMGLLDSSGKEIPLRLEGEDKSSGTHRVLELQEARQSFRFLDLDEEPVPSLMRGFSAPVYLESDLDPGELAFLMSHDSDSFNRWEAGQQLAMGVLLRGIEDHRAGRKMSSDPSIQGAFEGVLENPDLDPALAAQALYLPSQNLLAERVEVIDPVAIHEARKHLQRSLAQSLREGFMKAYESNRRNGSYSLDPRSMGRRALRNLSLAYLMTLKEGSVQKLALRQYREADNMTDSFSALASLVFNEAPQSEEVLDHFEKKWKKDALVMDKWFSLQAMVSRSDTLASVKKLTGHEDFDLRNPNRVRALLNSFAFNNPLCFHREDGGGYEFIADRIIELNALNPQVAARLSATFNRWKRFDSDRQGKMRQQMERILATDKLSSNVYEIISKALDLDRAVSV
ncbi:MAG: aminopeptidase N [Candidatus Krumholzibacteria bacterium]|jgi:aminopeptidase N|nr:aminopeptidase N [Candidatus Krumholzibacteria bacterium]